MIQNLLKEEEEEEWEKENKDRITPKVPARVCRKVPSVLHLNRPPCQLLHALLRFMKPSMNMQPNIWLMPLLHDAGGWGQQTANPALLTSGSGELERRWIEERSGKEGSEE